MIKQKHTHYISVRINPLLYKAIRTAADIDHVKPSKLIRELITDKLQDIGTSKTT